METRVKRYSRKNRIKRKIKKMGFWKIIRKILKILLKNMILLIIGFAYESYILIKGFNNIIAKLFMMMPRIQKVALIYLLVINFGMSVYDTFYIYKPKNIKESVLKKVAITNTPEIPQNLTVEEEKKEECIFDEVSCKIHSIAKKIGMNEEQTLISIAISRWETGNYTSKAFKEKNNVGGMMCTSGLIHYNSLDEGIEKFLINLKNNYFDIGLDTIEKIQKKYCPVGAANDPTGLNQYWLGGVTNLYNEMKGGK